MAEGVTERLGCKEANGARPRCKKEAQVGQRLRCMNADSKRPEGARKALGSTMAVSHGRARQLAHAAPRACRQRRRRLETLTRGAWRSPAAAHTTWFARVRRGAAAPAGHALKAIPEQAACIVASVGGCLDEVWESGRGRWRWLSRPAFLPSSEWVEGLGPPCWAALRALQRTYHTRGPIRIAGCERHSQYCSLPPACRHAA